MLNTTKKTAWGFNGTLYSTELESLQAELASLESDLSTNMTALIDGAGTTASKVSTIISDLKSGGTISSLALKILEAQDRITNLSG